MRRRIIIGLMAVVITSGLSAQKGHELKDQTDSVSYALGISMYDHISQFKDPVNIDRLLEGFVQASDSTAVMDADVANEYIADVSERIREKEKMKRIMLGERFFVENQKVEGIVTTRSGLQYRVIKEGEGDSPTQYDSVRVHYTGYLLDGTKFESTHDRHQPAELAVNKLIRGFGEALQLMKPGAEYVVYIPYFLAYGDRKAGPLILPGSSLMFEIELLEVL